MAGRVRLAVTGIQDQWLLTVALLHKGLSSWDDLELLGTFLTACASLRGLYTR